MPVFPAPLRDPVPSGAAMSFVWRDNDRHRDDIELHYPAAKAELREAGALLASGRDQREQWALHLGLISGLRSQELRGLRGRHVVRLSVMCRNSEAVRRRRGEAQFFRGEQQDRAWDHRLGAAGLIEVADLGDLVVAIDAHGEAANLQFMPNPPIDSIREEVIMSLECYIGPERNLLATTEQLCWFK